MTPCKGHPECLSTGGTCSACGQCKAHCPVSHAWAPAPAPAKCDHPGLCDQRNPDCLTSRGLSEAELYALTTRQAPDSPRQAL